MVILSTPNETDRASSKEPVSRCMLLLLMLAAVRQVLVPWQTPLSLQDLLLNQDGGSMFNQQATSKQST